MSMSDGTQVSISRVHLPVYSSPSSLPCSSSDVSVSRNHTPCAEYALPDADPFLIEAGCRLTRTKHVSRRQTCGDRHRSYRVARASNTARRRASESVPLAHLLAFCFSSPLCRRLPLFRPVRTLVDASTSLSLSSIAYGTFLLDRP